MSEDYEALSKMYILHLINNDFGFYKRCKDRMFETAVHITARGKEDEYLYAANLTSETFVRLAEKWFPLLVEDIKDIVTD